MGGLNSFARILMAPGEASGGGGAKKAKGKAKEPKPAPKAAPKGKGKAPVKAQKPAPEDDDEEDELEEDEEDELEEDETDDDELEEDDDEQPDEDEEDEEEESAARTQPKSKPKTPKLVSIPAKELRDLKRKAGEAEHTAKVSQKRKEQVAREREERLAAEDGGKALEMARKRMQRTLNEKETALEQTSAERDKYKDLYVGRAFTEGFDTAVQEAVEERGLKLRPKAMKYVRASLRERFEPIEDDDGEIIVVEKESGKHISDVLPNLVEGEDFELFLADAGDAEEVEGGEEGTGRTAGRTPARVNGTHKRPSGVSKGTKKNEKKLTYAGAYKARMKELEESEGVKPGFGLTRPIRN